ncbi:MAG: PilZ domain-containing protein, partial [Candidatus Xenobia bacterium]
PVAEAEAAAAAPAADAAAGQDGANRGGIEQRRGKRAEKEFTVVSRDLQRFKAMCGDISSTGMRILAREELPAGKRLDLDLDFGDPTFPKVRFEAEVVWCKPKDKTSFWVGLRFTDMAATERRLLETFVENVERQKTEAQGV